MRPSLRSTTAALLSLSLALSPAATALGQGKPGPSASPAAGSKDVPVSDEAKKHFKAGVDFLKDPDGARYEEAYREFKKAYQISPSWKILGNLGLCALKLERNSEAVEAYERYLKEAGSDVEPGERAQIEKDVNLVKTSSAPATLSATGAAGEISVLDQRIKASGAMAVNVYALAPGKPLKLLLQAGRHVMIAKAGGREEKWEIDLSAGQAVEHTFRLDAPQAAASSSAPAPAASAAPSAPPTSSASPVVPPPPTGAPPLRTAGYVGAGVGGALLIAGVVTGIMGKSKLSDLDAACPDKRCPSSKKSDADSIESLQTLTNVFLIGGGVLAAAGVALIVVGPSESDSRSQASAPSRPRLGVSPLALPQGGGFVASGSF